MNLRKLLLALLMLLPFVWPVSGSAEGRRTLLDLKGGWKFDIGDEMERARPDFDDRNWATVKVPSPWEDQGFPGYDGYGWYRKHFSAKPEWMSKFLTLRLGMIDDVDEVFVNGHFIGFSGSFPPNYITAYNLNRQYNFPAEILNPSGDNVIAVRVYDSQLAGGITHGEVAIVERTDVLTPDITLQEGWKFKVGDDPKFGETEFDDAAWEKINVPAFWETQGHRGYDGFGWYRLKFRFPASLGKERLILLLGKIDDIDEAYLNGVRIGRTGPPSAFGNFDYETNDYAKRRAYTIPDGLLRPDQWNVIAVRVFDRFLHGGIYEGPVGLVTRDRYVSWERRERTDGNWLQRFIESFFR